MRRSQADESRRRQAAAERRFRGHRIRGGLDELGDLDAPQEQKQRIEASPVAAEAPPLTKSNTAAVKVESPLLSSSGAVSATVFGPDWAEWVEVKRVLFDTTATVAEKRAALATVSVWRLRARKERQLPPYVEATEVLVDAMLQDEADALADGPQRMCYGAALSRVVHIMTGSFASGSADTYRKRAHEIGFPEEAVEARQRVAHGQLPLTSELRWVCGLTLQYLFAEYWLEQERQLYLMEKVDKTAVVRHRGDVPAAAAAVAQNEKQRKPFSKAKRNASAARAAAAAAAPASAPAPPTVSMDDMKALLADLEDEDAEEAQSASPEKSAVVSATAAGVSVPTVAENKGEMAQKHTCGGWHIS